MLNILARLCLVLALALAFAAGPAHAQLHPGGTGASDPANDHPTQHYVPAPEPTPSGTISNSTQGIKPYEPPVRQIVRPKEKLDLENTLYLDLEYGRVVIKLHPELAPKTVARFKELVRQGFYDGLVWHRVIDGFMAQTGDPKGDGTGGSGQSLAPEFNVGKHTRGAVSMARSANINSADSQFFIVLADSPHLNGQYTYFGEVVEGMEFVDQIRKGNPQRNGAVAYPDHILQIQVAADAVKKPQEQASAQQPASGVVKTSAPAPTKPPASKPQ